MVFVSLISWMPATEGYILLQAFLIVLQRRNMPDTVFLYMGH